MRLIAELASALMVSGNVNMTEKVTVHRQQHFRAARAVVAGKVDIIALHQLYVAAGIVFAFKLGVKTPSPACSRMFSTVAPTATREKSPAFAADVLRSS